MSNAFSHIMNNHPAMVDVSHKATTKRHAVAVSVIKTAVVITDLVNCEEILSKKGPVFNTAIIAGTMAAKNTHALIPLCHPLGIDDIKIAITIPKSGEIRIECSVKSVGRTGVEMEALTGASIAALTVYDMCKSLSFDMEISTKLIKKTGGKSERHADSQS